MGILTKQELLSPEDKLLVNTMLTEATSTQFLASSILPQFKIKSLSGEDEFFIDICNPIAVRFQSFNTRPILYGWRKKDSLDGLSNTYYGTTSLWWFIQMVNGIVYQEDIRVGQTIAIPRMEAIYAFIESMKLQQTKQRSTEQIEL